MAKILLVDDAAFMRKVIKDTLTKNGYTDLYEAVDGVYRWDDSLGEIILEIAGAYFAGDKSLDETAELIQNRAKLYISEQS